MHRVLLALVLSLPLTFACSAPVEDDGVTGGAAITSTTTATASLDSVHRLRADRLVSVFENSTIEIQYDYVEDINDGRGYTAGRGFTTATGDVLSVTQDYLQSAPNDPLALYVPELQRLADAESSDTSNLQGFPDAWKAAAQTEAMKAAEDREVDRSSYEPALAHARALGIHTSLALAELYDAVVMNGDGDDADGVPALIHAATSRAGGTPKAGVSEHKWLQSFLTVRRADLAHAHDPETRKEWAKAVSRVDVFSDLLAAGNDDLDGPIHVGREFDIDVP